MKKPIILLLAMLLLSEAVLGISISSSPFGPNPMLYEPGYTLTKTYDVTQYGYDADVYVTGDLAKFAEVYNIIDYGGAKTFTMTMTLPEESEYPLNESGIHNLYVVAEELAPPEAGISAVAQVQKLIMVMVLYDEPKAKFYNFIVPNINEEEQGRVSFTAESISKQTMTDMWADIELLNYDGEVVKTLRTDNFELKSAEKKQISVDFDTANIIPGKFYTKGKIHWYGEVTELNTEFNIGTLNVDIINISRNFTAGQINKLRIEVENKWNGRIESMYAQLFIDDTETEPTSTYAMTPFELKEIVGYLDLTYIKAGEHNLSIILNFDGESTAFEEAITIKGKSKIKPFDLSFTSLSLEIMMFLVIIVLLISVLALFLKSKKK